MSGPSRARWPRSDDRVAAALAASALFLLAWGLVHTWFWGHGELVDWPSYRAYGAAIRAGGVPYRDFPVEYPPGALPAFVLPTLLGGGYASTFAWTMAACGVVLVWVVAVLSPRAALYVALAPVLAGSLILSRFDLWPALLATGALVALLRNRHGLGWALLGAAVAAKLWPLVLVPPALVWSLRHGRVRAAAYGAAVLACVTVPFLIVAPHGLVASVTGQASRPLQVESLGAALLTTFSHPQIVNSHGSQNITGHGALGAVFAVVELAALVALWFGFARGAATPERFTRYSAACICAFIAFNKVLSPQYLLWLIPVVPLVRGRRGLAATGLLTAALLLTQVWFPWRYYDYALRFHLAGVVLLRDLVLVALLAVLALPFMSRR
jgi:glycosyl transferase family 87